MNSVSRDYSISSSTAGSILPLVVLGFAVRLIAGLLIPEIIVYDDEIYYQDIGSQIAGHYAFGTVNPYSKFGWHTITGFLYYLTVSDPFVIKLFNSALGVWSAFLVAGAVLRIYRDETMARTALYACLFLPPAIFLSATLLKEQLAAFCLCLFVYAISRRDLRGVLYAVLAAAVMLWIRNSFVYVMIGALALAWLATSLMASRLSFGARVALIFLLLAGATFGGTALQRTEFYKTTKVGLVLGGVDERGLETIRRQDMTVFRYLDRENILSPRNIVIPPVRALYTPSPLRGFKSPEIHIVVLEGIVRAAFWYLAVPFAAIALFRSKSFSHFVFVGAAIGVFLAAAYTILTGFPESERYRWPMLPLLLALAAVGWRSVGGDSQKRLILWGWWGSAVIFNAYYLL